MQCIEQGSYKVIVYDEITDIHNDNIDIEVIFSDKTRYSATVFTVKNIETLMEKDAKTGENNDGQYLWCPDLLIIHDLKEVTILDTIQHLIDENKLSSVFQLLENDDDYDYWLGTEK